MKDEIRRRISREKPFNPLPGNALLTEEERPQIKTKDDEGPLHRPNYDSYDFFHAVIGSP